MITFEYQSRDTTVTIEVNNDHTIEECVNGFVNLLRCVGFTDHTIAYGLADHEQVTDQFLKDKVVLLSKRELANALEASNLSQEAQEEVIADVFGSLD